jgi:hypothetical protein
VPLSGALSGETAPFRFYVTTITGSGFPSLSIADLQALACYGQKKLSQRTNYLTPGHVQAEGEQKMKRAAFVLTPLCTVALLWAAPALAANSHTGKVVEAGGGKLTMTDTVGQNQHTHDVPADAKILCSGKPCGLENLKAGDTIKVTLGKKDDQTVVTMIRDGKAPKHSKAAQ